MDDDSESYMNHAESDLITAKKLDGDEESDARARAFHSHQAAEKAIKAVIAASGREPQWTHDLVILTRNLPTGCSTGVSDFDLAVLTEYATTSRYGNVRISKRDADAALNVAKDVVGAMQACL